MALVWLALALVAAWLVLELALGVAGFAIHLLLFAAAVLLVAWAVRKAWPRLQRSRG